MKVLRPSLAYFVDTRKDGPKSYDDTIKHTVHHKVWKEQEKRSILILEDRRNGVVSFGRT